MADVTIKYKDNAIAEMSESGSKTLPTSGKYCEGDIVVDYVPHYKEFFLTSPTAVASQDVTVVTGDPDVATHYADENAMVTVRKISNNDTNGLAMLVNTNHYFGHAYGFYVNYNVSSNNSGNMFVPLTATTEEATGGTPTVRCNANGDIIVFCNRLQNNFGGADYIITFSW